MRIIHTEVPDKFAILLTVGEYGPIYMNFNDMNDLNIILERHMIEMIGQGYAGYEVRNRI